jgi:hypothetical protein
MQGGVVQIVIDDSTDKIVTGRIEYDRANGGTFIGPYGTTLPASPEDYEWFLKTDTNELYYYNGTSWELIAGGAVVTWGTITGTLSDQTDLQNALDAKADDSDLTAHTGDLTIHFTEASIDHTAIQNVGTNTHTQIDSHIADGTIHFAQGAIDHTAILNIGTNSHSQIDTHIGDVTIHFTEASIDHTAISNIGTNSHAAIDSHIADGTIHFTEASIDHTAIQNVGTNTHAQIDTHIGDATIHFTEASIDHTAIQNVGTNTHGQIDSHIADGTIHFTEASIDHTAISNIGTNSHAAIDSHIADGTIHFTNSSILHNDRSDLQGGDTGEYYHLKESEYNWIANVQDALQEFTGFTNPENITVTYNSVARTITLTGTVEAYWQGQLVSALTSGWTSDAHSASPTGPLYLSYNGTSFVWSETAWTFDQMQIAYVIVDGGTPVFALREVHGLMQWQAHKLAHQTIGTYREDGGDVTGFTYNSTTPADRRPETSECTITDEDLPSILAAHTTTNNYTQWTLTGATGNPNFATGQAEIVPLSGITPQWNEFSGGTWGLTTLGNNEYMSVWKIAIPVTADATSQDYRFMWLPGQSADAPGFFGQGLTAQRNLTTADLDLGELEFLSPEYIFIEKVIIQETGAGDWQVIEQQRLIGTKFTQGGGGGGVGLTAVVTDNTIQGDGTAAAPLTVKKENVVTVAALGGAEYTSIQAAIDSVTGASQVNPYTIYINPGVYVESLTLKNNVNLKGVGPAASVIVAGVSGTLATFPDTAVSIEGITFAMTTTDGTSRIFSVASGGLHAVVNCVTSYTITNDNGTAVSISAGALTVAQLAIQYTHTGTGGGDHVVVDVGASGGALGSGVQIFGSIASDDDFYGFKSASNLTGDSPFSNVQLNMTVNTADYSSNVYGVYSSGSAIGSEFLGSVCKYRNVGGGTVTGEARHVTITGTGRVSGSSNRIVIAGFAENYFADVGVNGTFVSHYDDAVASSGVTGAGQFYYASSFEDGEVRISETLKVGDAINGNYLEVDQEGTINLFGTSRQTGTLKQKVPVLRRGTCDLATVAGVRCLAMDDTVDQNGSFSFLVPEDMDLTVDPIIRVFVGAREDQTTGSDMVIQVSEIRYLSFGEAFDKTPDQTNLSTTVTVDNSKRILTAADITLDASLMSSLDGIAGYIERVATSGDDDRNGDAIIPEVDFVYTKNKII